MYIVQAPFLSQFHRESWVMDPLDFSWTEGKDFFRLPFLQTDLEGKLPVWTDIQM